MNKIFLLIILLRAKDKKKKVAPYIKCFRIFFF